VMMLRYLEEFATADLIENAVLYTLEEGRVLTGDVVGYDRGAKTTEYTEAIIQNLGKTPKRAQVRGYKPFRLPQVDGAIAPIVPRSRRVVGVDVFVETDLLPEPLGKVLEDLAAGTPFRLKMVSNRGTQVYPPTGGLTDLVDHYRCRFLYTGEEAKDPEILDLVSRVASRFRWMHLEKLQEFDGEPGFTKAQGED
jgi:isocitrate dehydrogenase